MRARIRNHPEVVAYQQTDLAMFGLTREQCARAVQYADARGRTFAGADAVARVFVDAGLPWSPLGRLMLLPGIIHVMRAAYRWVAANRRRFRGDPA
ncbi:MAG: hypothetical protein RLZZ305_1379 [Actinomycetota bacterium]